MSLAFGLASADGLLHFPFSVLGRISSTQPTGLSPGLVPLFVVYGPGYRQISPRESIALGATFRAASILRERSGRP